MTGDFVVQVTTNDINWQPQGNGAVAARLILAAVEIDAEGKPVAQAGKSAVAKLSPEMPLSSIPFDPHKMS